MKVLDAHAAHDLRLEPCAALAPGAGEVAVNFSCGRICGSELHEFNHGGLGIVRLRDPIIQGQEVAGEVVTGLVIGDLVAVLPSRPRGVCGRTFPRYNLIEIFERLNLITVCVVH